MGLLMNESQQVMKEFKGSSALDAGLIASAQAVEHYEISRYGTLKAWAEQLSLREAGSLLDETLEEEKKTDEALSWGKPRSTKRLDRPRNDQWPQLRARTSVRQNTFACPAGNCRELSG
jgi:ferritin-like metal-binding protein YciE